jgi:hypothetical protein
MKTELDRDLLLPMATQLIQADCTKFAADSSQYPGSLLDRHPDSEA